MFLDRYSVLGIPRPDPKTVCMGRCEGTGVVPVPPPPERKGERGSLRMKPETDRRFRKLWDEAEAVKPSDDGWHFVKCPDCKGTGRRFGVDKPLGGRKA